MLNIYIYIYLYAKYTYGEYTYIYIWWIYTYVFIYMYIYVYISADLLCGAHIRYSVRTYLPLVSGMVQPGSPRRAHAPSKNVAEMYPKCTNNAPTMYKNLSKMCIYMYILITYIYIYIYIYIHINLQNI